MEWLGDSPPQVIPDTSELEVPQAILTSRGRVQRAGELKQFAQDKGFDGGKLEAGFALDQIVSDDEIIFDMWPPDPEYPTTQDELDIRRVSAATRLDWEAGISSFPEDVRGRLKHLADLTHSSSWSRAEHDKVYKEWKVMRGWISEGIASGSISGLKEARQYYSSLSIPFQEWYDERASQK